MEATIWFYTYSTVAQVMAGLVGLFAVFVVYKMQDFGDVLEAVRKKFVFDISHASNSTDEYESIRYEDALAMDDFAVLDHADKLLQIFGNPDTSQKRGEALHLNQESRDLFATLIATKRAILRKFAITLILSLLAIAISILALVETDYFLAHGYTHWFQTIFYLYFLFCLFYMGVNIYKIAIR
jgi:hypothetical protein